MTNTRDQIYREDLGRLIPRLRQVTRALVQDGTAGSGDDLVQATLVRALAADERRHGERLFAWLLGVAVSLNRAQVQAMSQNRISAGGRTAAGVSGSFPPRGAAEAGGDPMGLSTMPLEEREALVLVALGRLTYMQAAEVLNLSITVLVQRLSRARDRLAETMDGAPPVPAAAVSSAAPRRAGTHLRVVK